MSKAIGILGGMGPESSVYMYKVLIEKSVSEFGAKKNNDFPEILMHSIPVPDFISNDDTKSHALAMMRLSVLHFNKMNLACLSIACNTAHLLLADLQKISKTPFISMIDEVGKKVRKEGHIKVGILGTPLTIQSGLYQEVLFESGVDSLVPNEKQLLVLEKVIRRVIAGTAGEKESKMLVKLANVLKKNGADGIILGCTELPLIFPKRYPLPVYNSVEILASALLQKYYK